MFSVFLLMPMSRTLAAGAVSVLFVVSIIICMYSLLFVPAVEGFAPSDLHEPQQYTAQQLPSIPSVAGDWIVRPGVVVTISVGNIFERYGGTVSININNNGTRPLFIVDLGFDWVDYSMETIKEVHQEIPPGGSHFVKAIAVDGPPHAGHENYRLRIRALLFRNGQWYTVTAQGSDWLQFSEHTVAISALASDQENEILLNNLLYYEKTNDIVDFDSLAVEMAANIATATQGNNYNIGKVCAIFDYVNENVVYTDDPGGDVWYSPRDTLGFGIGDCEDYAMLIAAMVEDVGGTTRMYLTNDHAFAAVYLGNNESDLLSATEDVRAYYGTKAKVHAMVDEKGYWIVADPLGTFHLGGLAVGQSPTTGSGTEWNTSFPDTDTLYAIDITTESISLPIWLNTRLWLLLVGIFGVTDIFLILSLTSKDDEVKNCLACNGEIRESGYICLNCGSAYHQACAFQSGVCGNCGAPVRLPPPPPPTT